MKSPAWRRWIPGVLSKVQMKGLLEERVIASDKEVVMDASSLDLSISSQGYEMQQGSIKPVGGDYRMLLHDPDIAATLEPGPEGEFVLSARKTYVFQLREKLFAARLESCSLHGQATAKSSVGRMDVLARLIVDGMDEYESFTPHLASNGNGEMFLEITPMTFDVVVKEGIVNVSLADGEKLAKLIFYRMSEDAEQPDSEIAYGKQTLQLSKFFGEWGEV